MKRPWFGVVLALILTVLVGGVALAQTFPKSQGYVNDFASLLSSQGRASLETRLSQLEKDTSAEVAVVTIKSLEGYTIEDYAVRLFENWGIGKKSKDNGVLFLIASEEREVRIEVGYGLEAVITDSRAGRILDKAVVPRFKEGNYEAGIFAGVADIEAYVRGGSPPLPLEDNPVKRSMPSGFLTPILWVLGIASIYILGFMARSKSIWLGGIWGLVIGAVLGLAVGGLIAIILLPLLMAGVGTGLDYSLSKNYRERKSRGEPTRWDKTRGGFRGSGDRGSSGSHHFGGGRSGGGGASRGW